MRVRPSWSIALIGALALATSACKGDTGAPGPAGPTGPTGPASPASVGWIDPVDGQGSVPLDAVVRASFTNDMDAATVTSANFQLAAGATPVTATVSYNPGSRTAYLAPAVPLASFAYYTATLTTAVKDAGGNPLAKALTWSFWTSGSFTHSALYVGSFSNVIYVFNAPAFVSGSQLPDRSIAVTGLGSGPGLWLDTATDRLYITDFSAAGKVLVVNNASAANGTVAAAARTITGAATGLVSPVGAWLDPARDQLYVANYSNNTSNAIHVFANASTATGNVAPARTIAGAATLLAGPLFLPWLDVLGDQLYVANWFGDSVTVYPSASTATGNIAPSRTISGALTTLNAPTTLWLDKASDRLYVGNAIPGTVVVFDNASTATGNIAPSRTITTGGSPYGLWLDAATDRLYVSDFGANRIYVFNGASTISGTPTPARTITTAFGPAGLMFDPGN